MSTPRKGNAWLKQSVPHMFPQVYLSLIEERGLKPEAVLRQAGLPLALLSHPEADTSFLEFEYLLHATIAAIGDNGIGFDVGWRMPPTAYGSFGYALLCSATLGDAVKICQRFWQLIGRGMQLSVNSHEDFCLFEFSPDVPVTDKVVRRIMLESALSSVYRGFQLLLGTTAATGEIWFDFAEPNYSARVRERLPNVHYEMPSSLFKFPSQLLKTPLEMSNPPGLKFAVEQCEREEAMSGLTEQRLLARVQSKMVLGSEGYPDLEQLAQLLSMTSRTLRRKLQKEGGGYKSLLEDARRRDAIRLLDNRKLEIQKVAELLGYADPANFTRAFRLWTGSTPSQYRDTRRS